MIVRKSTDISTKIFIKSGPKKKPNEIYICNVATVDIWHNMEEKIVSLTKSPYTLHV